MVNLDIETHCSKMKGNYGASSNNYQITLGVVSDTPHDLSIRGLRWSTTLTELLWDATKTLDCLGIHKSSGPQLFLHHVAVKLQFSVVKKSVGQINRIKEFNG